MRRPLCMAALLLAAAVILYTRIVPVPLPDYGSGEGREIVLSGSVSQKEYKQSSYGGERLVISLKSISVQGIPPADISGELIESAEGALCYMKENTEPEMGAKIVIRGVLRPFEEAANRGQFDSRLYYKILRLDFKLMDAVILEQFPPRFQWRELLYRVKAECGRTIDACFLEQDAGIMRAMLLGERGSADEQIKEIYQRSGIIHIMAISGLHISVIGMGLFRLCRKARMPAAVSACLSAAVMYGYGIMTGCSPSAVRAVFMFGVKMAAQVAGRTYDMATALALAAALMLCSQPLYSKHSGFLLSFGAVASVLLITPFLKAIFPGKRNRILREGALSGAAAAIGTFPIQISFYYQYPVYSVLLNLLVIPLMPLVMAAGLFVLAVGHSFPAVGSAAGYAVHVVLKLYETACEASQRLPGANWITGRPGFSQAAVYYLTLAVLLLYGKKLPELQAGLIMVIAAGLLVFRFRTGLYVTFLDVGQGDCIYVEQGRFCALFDGGSSSVSEAGSRRIVPYLKSRGTGALDYVFISHTDEDHCNGLRELAEDADKGGIEVRNIVLPDIAGSSRSDAYRDLEEMARSSGAGLLYCSTSDEWRAGGLRVRCLSPDKNLETQEPNEFSQVFLVEYGAFRLLLTGDITGGPEEKLKEKLKAEGTVSVLKAAHHGSKYSTDAEFLQITKPMLCIVSCGKNNRYGHPHAVFLRRLEDARTRALITSEKGAVELWTQGDRITVKTYK